MMNMLKTVTGIYWIFLSTLSLLISSPVYSAPTGFPMKPSVQQIGKHHYRIGSIQLDKQKQRFRVPGVVIRLDPPLEFLAVTRGSQRGYESLLELDSNAYEFNLACILIGLTAKQAVLSRYHFDTREVEGDPVKITIVWNEGGKLIEVDAGKLLLEEGKRPEPGTWAYTGSHFTPNNRYMADLDEVLIGFVHDPASIIEHRLGLALGNYGGVGADQGAGLALGKTVTLIVEKVIQDRSE